MALRGRAQCAEHGDRNSCCELRALPTLLEASSTRESATQRMATRRARAWQMRACQRHLLLLQCVPTYERNNSAMLRTHAHKPSCSLVAVRGGVLTPATHLEAWREEGKE